MSEVLSEVIDLILNTDWLKIGSKIMDLISKGVSDHDSLR